MRHRRARGDDGASLVLVLVFVASFGLIVPALLGLAQTSVTSVAATRAVTDVTLDADAATDQAVNRVRNGTFYNSPAQPCFHDPADLVGTTDSSAMEVTGANTGRKVLVTCQAAPATGFPTSVRVPITSANRPGQALLTLSRATGEAGIRQTANNVLRISGRVFSNSGIEVTNPNARLEVSNAPLIARGACDLGSGTVVGSPKSCNDSTQDSLGADPAGQPGYQLPTTLPVQVTAPTCGSSPAGYTLSPGTYRSASALSALTRTSCKALLHFTSGVYYFDFPDSDPVWSVTDGYVVGGSIPTGTRAWTTAGYPLLPPKVPGACVGPTEIVPPVATNGGVLFVFGGQSRMSISGGGKVELCGRYSTTEPPIAVYGANTGSGQAPVTVPVGTDGSSTGTGSDFTSSQNIRLEDGTTSDAAIVASNAVKSVAAVAVSMPATATVPSGARLTSASLRVTHQEARGVSTVQGSTTYPPGPITGLSVSFSPRSYGNGSAPDVAPAAQPTVRDLGARTPDTLDITSELRPYFDAYGFTGINTTFKATAALGTSALEKLDAIRLEVTYELPGFRQGSGCVVATPYTNGSGPCALITANGSNSETRLYVQGTTYAPKAALDITLNNVSEQVFRFGLIARTVKVSITGSSSFADAVIAVPDVAAGYTSTVPLAVHLQTWSCEASTCASPPVPAPQGWVPASGSGWKRRVSARVRVSDAAYPPTAALRQTDVESWAHLR